MVTPTPQRLSIVVAAFLGAGAALAADPVAAPSFTYVRRATREATRDATLAQYAPALALGPWHVLGPFDNAGMDQHDVVFPPEIAVDLAAQYEGKGGRRIRWAILPDAEWSHVELKRFGDDASDTYGVAYLFREFTAPADARFPFEMGSDDGLKVWLNGRLLVDADSYRGMNIQDHLVELPIAAGRNALLVKVTQGVGSWEFQMRPRIDSRVLALLEHHLNRDFPTSREFAHYQPLSVLEPADVVLEVGGLAVMPDGRPIVATRRGEVWIVDGAYDDPPFSARFTRFAFGLHEPLGAAWHDSGLLLAQRGEVTRLVDKDGDDRADRYETVTSGWGVSGNYHEFAFGPELDGAGRLWVTLNVGFCGSLGKSIVPWRGWALIVSPDDGAITPVCGGLRSPNTLGRNAAGDMFCCDNQGDWVGTNKLMHLEFGDWHGHPAGDRWYEAAGMRPPRGEADFKPPAVWFPYDRMGRSASDILLDETGGAFGPFAGQLFVGDQYAASVMRVFLERVEGVYQGACFPFLSGLDCGVNRLAWGKDGSLFVGMTNRGWWSFGARPWGLARVVYTGKEPFEVKEMRARPDGFEVEFTRRVDRRSAGAATSYALASFTYLRHATYGSPEVDRADHAITEATVSDDGRTVRLRTSGMRPRYVHELHLAGIRDEGGAPLLHAEAYYTLNVIPSSERHVRP
jgi:glucose/arabinose dehydrogenase